VSDSDKSESTIFFIDEVIHDLKQSIKKPPTKINLIAYMHSWLNTLETIKAINK